MKPAGKLLSYWLYVLGLAVVYFIAGRVGLLVAFGPEHVSPVWPPAGVALAALWLFGTRLWPGIAIGQLAVVLHAGEPLLSSIGVTVGNTLQPLLAVYLLRRFSRFDPALTRLQDVLGLGVWAATSSTIVGATVGVTAIVLNGSVPWSAFGSVWLVYWLGDALGVLVVAPLLLTWATWPTRLQGLTRTIEAGALLACLVSVTQLAFGGWAYIHPSPEALEYAVFPLLIWAALRFGPPGAAAVSFVVSLTAITGTVAGYGPFAGGTLKQALVLLQAFLAVVAVTGMALAAITSERRHAEQDLEASRERLRNLSMRLQSIREEERKRIAREIHDQLGQTLTVLKVDLSLLGRRKPNGQELLQRTESMSQLVDTSIETVRRLSSELRPRVLDDLGLVAAIEWQAEEFQKRTGIQYQIDISPKRMTIDPERSTACFRIFQEALTNVARHANASRLFISLSLKEGRIWLRVKDNGTGIAREKLLDPKASGLVGMRERVYPWRGEVQVLGAPGQGTEVVVMIPLAESSNP